MASYTFPGLTPGRTAFVHSAGRGGSGGAVASGTVAGDGTVTVSLPTGDYVARDGRTQVYLYAADAVDAAVPASHPAGIVVENGVPIVIIPD